MGIVYNFSSSFFLGVFLALRILVNNKKCLFKYYEGILEKRNNLVSERI